MTVIGDDGAPRAERTVVLWNPPLLDAELGLRGSALAEAAKLQAGLRRARAADAHLRQEPQGGRAVHRFTAERLGDDSQLSPYRAGYTAEQRREIERRLAAGDLLGVSSTDALELGIDIGLLDAVISVGFPGTVASLRQQWGRAGTARSRARRARRDRGRARPVLHARARQAARAPRRGCDPRPREPARPRRPRPRRGLRGADRRERRRAPRRGGAGGGGAPTRSCARPRAASSGPGRRRPAARLPLRSADADSFTVVDASTGAVLGFVERSRAYSTVHRGRRLPPPRRVVPRHASSTSTALRAVVEPFRGDWYTQPKRDDRDDDPRPSSASERRLGLELVFGEVEVTDQVVGYERKTIASQERIELVPLDCPPDDLQHRGGLVLPRARRSSAVSTRCRSSSAPCMRPSTR